MRKLQLLLKFLFAHQPDDTLQSSDDQPLPEMRQQICTLLDTLLSMFCQ